MSDIVTKTNLYNSKLNFEETINYIKDTILDRVNAKYIYLFGSCAWGTPDKSSDIDIYTVLPDSYKDTLDIYTDIVLKLSYNNIFFIDLLLIPYSVFNSRKENYIFEKNIFTKGKLIYAS